MKEKKKIDLWKIIASLGINGMGKTASQELVEHFRDFDAIRKASVSELECVGNIGTKTAIPALEISSSHPSMRLIGIEMASSACCTTTSCVM
jgi:NAD-dependent DNA ligase